MKAYNYILLFALFSVSIFLISISFKFDANTGNESFDDKLNEINKDALADISAFKTSVAKEYKVEEAEVSTLISNMEPAEILLTYELSRLTNRPIPEILNNYQKNKTHGWKKIFLSLGISSNSGKFNDLSKVELKSDHNHSSLSKR